MQSKGVARGVRGIRTNPPFAIALAPIADDAGSDEYTHLHTLTLNAKLD